MSVITPGTTFANGEQLTASDLNLLVQGASFSQNAVDNNSTILVGSAITVADGGITSAKLDADAVTTSKILDGEVTKAKIENVSAPLKVLGRMSAGAGAVEEVAVISDDELVGASATTLATSASIKAYVDENGSFTPSTYTGGESVTLPNNLIMKFGTQSVAADGTSAVSFATAFPGGITQVQLTFQTLINVGSDAGLSASSQLVTGFTLQSGAANTETVAWMAIGY